MTIVKSAAIAVAVCALVAITPASAQKVITTTDAKTSLKGLPGVYVLVEKIKPDVEKAGLKASDVLADVERQLRSSGTRVLTESEMQKATASPILYVNVNTVNSSTGFYGVDVRVTLMQNVILHSGPDIAAETWEVSTVSVLREAELPTVREIVKDRVAEFLKDWLAAHLAAPKPK